MTMPTEVGTNVALKQVLYENLLAILSSESATRSSAEQQLKLLETNHKSWDSKLKFALWADQVTDKRSIGTSPFKLVYGTEAIFPIQLILPVEKFFQEEEDEPNDMVRRMMDLVELQQVRE